MRLILKIPTLPNSEIPNKSCFVLIKSLQPLAKIGVKDFEIFPKYGDSRNPISIFYLKKFQVHATCNKWVKVFKFYNLMRPREPLTLICCQKISIANSPSH